MAKSETYDSKPEAKPTGKLPGPASEMSQRQVYSQTGKVKTPAEAGDSGKCSTKFNY